MLVAGASPSATPRQRRDRRSLANRAARRSGLPPRLQPCKYVDACVCVCACVSAPVCTRVTSLRVSSRVSAIHPSERSSPASNMSRNRACTSSLSRGSFGSSVTFLLSLRETEGTRAEEINLEDSVTTDMFHTEQSNHKTWQACAHGGWTLSFLLAHRFVLEPKYA